MSQLEESIRSTLEHKMKSENKYMTQESINRCVSVKIDQIAEWLVKKFTDETEAIPRGRTP